MHARAASLGRGALADFGATFVESDDQDGGPPPFLLSLSPLGLRADGRGLGVDLWVLASGRGTDLYKKGPPPYKGGDYGQFFLELLGF